MSRNIGEVEKLSIVKVNKGPEFKFKFKSKKEKQTQCKRLSEEPDYA